MTNLEAVAAVTPDSGDELLNEPVLDRNANKQLRGGEGIALTDVKCGEGSSLA